MIYLIQSGNLYKIGYTNNLEHRFDQYKQHNPTAILLDSKEGSRKDESNLHKLCEEYRIDRPEWFDSDKVVTIFKDYIPIKEDEKEEDKIKESAEENVISCSGEYVYEYTFCDNFSDLYIVCSPVGNIEIRVICLLLTSFFKQYNLNPKLIITKSLLQKLLKIGSKNTLIKREKLLEDLGFIKVERYKESTVLFNNFTILDFYTRLIDDFKSTPINELDELEKYVGIGNAKLDDYYLYPYWNGVKYDNIIKS
jgi:hypothetical protein